MNVCRRGRDPAVHLSAPGHWPHLISPPAVREAGTTWELLHSNRLSTQTWVQVLTARCLLDVFTHCHITASGALICSWRKVSLFGVVCVKAAMFDQFLGFSVNAPCVASLWSRRANTAWRVMFIAHVVWKPIRGDERDSQRVFVCHIFLCYFTQRTFIVSVCDLLIVESIAPSLVTNMFTMWPSTTLLTVVVACQLLWIWKCAFVVPCFCPFLYFVCIHIFLLLCDEPWKRLSVMCFGVSGCCSVFAPFYSLVLCFCDLQPPDTDDLLGPSKDDGALPVIR